MRIVLDEIECPYCGQHHEFKEWIRCFECDGVFHVSKVAGGYEIADVGGMTDAEIQQAKTI